MQSAIAEQVTCLEVARLLPEMLQCVGLRSLLPEGFSEQYGVVLVEESQKGHPWSVALVQTEEQPDIARVLNDPRIQLQLPYEMRHQLRSAVHTSAEAVWYMLLTQLQLVAGAAATGMLDEMLVS